MHVEEYRFFVTEVKTLEAENGALKRVLALERASFDAVIQAADEADRTRREERAEFEAQVQALGARVNTLERQARGETLSKWIPGVIGGVRLFHGEPEAVVGLGWKIPLW
jgi:hypothetical protein